MAQLNTNLTWPIGQRLERSEERSYHNIFYTTKLIRTTKSENWVSLDPSYVKTKGLRELVQTAFSEWTDAEEPPDGEICVNGELATEATLAALENVPEPQVEEPDPQVSDFTYLDWEAPNFLQEVFGNLYTVEQICTRWAGKRQELIDS